MSAPRSHFHSLRCSATGEILPPDRLHNLSAAGKPIVCEYDLDAMRKQVTRDEIAARPRGLWRWRELLPLPGSEAPVTLGEGDTPLLPAGRLSKSLHLDQLWIKDESQNPTGSFKARGMTTAVTMAKHLGAKVLSVPSAGNAGGALAAYAARAGMPAHVYVPADTPEVNRREVVLLGATLHEIDGLIDECGRVAASQRDALGAFDVSTLKEPYRLEGKKTMGLELAEQLGWRVPDVVLYPTGGGTGLIGMMRAFDQLAALGWIDPDKRPRMIVVQAEGCAPMVRAFEAGASSATRWENASTCASGLRVPGAVGDFLILDAVRRTGGTAIAVSEEEIVRDTKVLAAHTGVTAGPEGGACLAALRRLLERGDVVASDEIVLFNTGAGTKYVEALRLLDPLS